MFHWIVTGGKGGLSQSIIAGLRNLGHNITTVKEGISVVQAVRRFSV